MILNVDKLAKALGVDSTCTKVEIDFIREKYGVSVETAREVLIEPRILKRITQLVEKIEGKNEH